MYAPTHALHQRTWRYAGALPAAACLLLALLVALASPHDDQPAAAATAPLSGAYVGGGDTAAAAAFGTWRGRPLQVVTEYVPGETWSTLASPVWAADQWKGKGYLVAWGVPMLPKSGGSMSTGAAGGYDAYFRQLSQTLVSRGLGESVIRLGWEMNGTWYRWSAVNDPATYVAYWRQVVTAMRSISGAAFRFEWAPNAGQGTSGFDVASAYPGDSYVDLIGMSFYDQNWTYASTEVEKRWDAAVNERFGLSWRAAFAQAHGKRSTLSEWGLSQRCDGHGGNDNAYYMQKIKDWTAAHGFFYESYFDRDMNSCERHAIRSGAFPKGSDAYRRAFGASATATPSPNQGSRLDTAVLRVSWYADRHDDKTLHGMRVNTRVYVFVRPGVAATRIRFYLDDPTMSRAPRHVENAAPWDLLGGSQSAATPLDVSTLSHGTHTLTVAVETSTGTRTAQASFTR